MMIFQPIVNAVKGGSKSIWTTKKTILFIYQTNGAEAFWLRQAYGRIEVRNTGAKFFMLIIFCW